MLFMWKPRAFRGPPVSSTTARCRVQRWRSARGLPQETRQTMRVAWDVQLSLPGAEKLPTFDVVE